jgi:hypothetical protein
MAYTKEQLKDLLTRSIKDDGYEINEAEATELVKDWFETTTEEGRTSLDDDADTIYDEYSGTE